MSYPPLTPLEDYPLHSGANPDTVWACSAPERPRDEKIGYDWRCRGCVFAANAHVIIQGDEVLYWTRGPGWHPEDTPLSWLVARSEWWFEHG